MRRSGRAGSSRCLCSSIFDRTGVTRREGDLRFPADRRRAADHLAYRHLDATRRAARRPPRRRPARAARPRRARRRTARSHRWPPWDARRSPGSLTTYTVTCRSRRGVRSCRRALPGAPRAPAGRPAAPRASASSRRDRASVAEPSGCIDLARRPRDLAGHEGHVARDAHRHVRGHRPGGAGSSIDSSERRRRISASFMASILARGCAARRGRLSSAASRARSPAGSRGVPSRSGRPRSVRVPRAEAYSRHSSRTGQRAQIALATASRAFFSARRSK